MLHLSLRSLRSYNHIKHLVDAHDDSQSSIGPRLSVRRLNQNGRCQARFNYYGYDRPKYTPATGIRSIQVLYLPEHLNNTIKPKAIARVFIVMVRLPTRVSVLLERVGGKPRVAIGNKLKSASGDYRTSIG